MAAAPRPYFESPPVTEEELMTYSPLLASPDGRHRDPRSFARPDEPRSRLVLRGTAPPWVEPVVRALDRALRLEPNWAGTPSVPVEQRLAESAINDVLAFVMPNEGAPPPQVVPRVDGGLQLEWHQGGWDVEVSLSPLGEVWVDAAMADGSLEWDGDLASRKEELRLILASIAYDLGRSHGAG